MTATAKKVLTERGYYHVVLAAFVGGTITVIHEVLYRLSKGDDAELEAFGIASHGTGDMVMMLVPVILILWLTEFMRHRADAYSIEVDLEN